MGYGDDPVTGIDDVVIVDLSTDSQTLLTNLMPFAHSNRAGKNISLCLWIDEETVLVNTHQALTNKPVPYAGVHDTVFDANSVVSSNLSQYTIVAGNPAREIRKRFDDEIIEIILKFKWQNLPANEITKLISNTYLRRFGKDQKYF